MKFRKKLTQLLVASALLLTSVSHADTMFDDDFECILIPELFMYIC